MTTQSGPVFTRFNQVISTELTNKIVTDLSFCHIREAREAAEYVQDRSIQAYVKDCLAYLSDALTQGNLPAVALFEVDLDFLGACTQEVGAATACVLAHIQQIVGAFKKRADLDVGIDKEAAAWQSFEESEIACLETNRVFRQRERGEITFRPAVEQALMHARRKILQVLDTVGPPPLSDVQVRFGKGSTTRTPKRIASARRKLREGLVCGEGFLSNAQASVWEIPGWYSHRFDDDSIDSALLTVYVDDGRLEFVPKNCKTYRAVTPSPNLDVMFQLGIGDYMTRRLRKFGVDLSDQEASKSLARTGSLTGALATLDLSSASDTISIELVYDLLPVDWANFLWSYRTPTVRYKDKVLKLQKFSSMGNGFTFPLESLIFWSLAQASINQVGPSERTCAVYGDDIIVPVECVAFLDELLTVCGFKLNKLKSFSSGHFRESCGGDYLWGYSVRPCYVKDRLHCSDLFVLHNYYVRNGYEQQAKLCEGYIAPKVRMYGPDGYGDGHLLGAYVLKPVNRKLGWGISSFSTYTREPVWDFPRDGTDQDRAFPAYNVYANRAQCGLPDLRMPVEELNWRYGRRAAFHNVALSSIRYVDDFLGTIVPDLGRYRKTKIHTFEG